MKAAKNLVYKCMAFVRRLFVNQQGERTKKGMDVPIMYSVMLLNELAYFFRFGEALKSNRVAGMFKKKKRGTSEGNEPNTCVVNLFTCGFYLASFYVGYFIVGPFVYNTWPVHIKVLILP